MRRSWLLFAALLLAVVAPANVLAARAWQIDANPSTLTNGVSTAVRLTVRNTGDDDGGDEMTCVRIQVPASFTISSVGIVSVYGQTSGAAYDDWQAIWPGAGVVAFKNTSDDTPLIGSTPPNDVAVFRITGTTTSLVSMTWTATAADHSNGGSPTTCGSGAFSTKSLIFVVLPDILPTAAPTPTPKPTPVPTATPTPTPAPTATPKVTPSPTVKPTPTPAPTATAPPGSTPTPTRTPAPGPTASPGATSTPSASMAPTPTFDASPSPLTTSPPAPSPPASPDSGSAPGGGGGLALPGDQSQAGGGAGVPVGGLGGAVSTALDSLPGGLAVWAFPAFIMSVPGLLLLIAIGAQALGALAWLPLVRKRLGAFGIGRRSRAA